MRVRTLVAAMVVVLAAGQASWAQINVYTTMLNGTNSGTGSPGVGSSTVTIDLAAQTMRVEADFSDLNGNVTISHIHCCTDLPGTGNASVATPTPTFPGFPVGVTAGFYDTTFDLTDPTSFNGSFVTSSGGTAGDAANALVAGMDAGKAYLNIHTSLFGSGEIRGYYAWSLSLLPPL